MKYNYKQLFTVIIALSCVIKVFAADSPAGKPKAKYVFLFIGDGMGQAHIDVTEKAFEARDKHKLWMNTLPVKGSVDTSSYGGKVTDSAAAATAIACGHKTRNGVLGMEPDGKALETVAELAKKLGLKVGIVSNAPLNHATPAGFYAHQPQRGMYDEIAGDLAASGFEYFGGNTLLSKNKHKDVLRKLRENNYTMIDSPEKLPQLEPGKKYIVHAEIPYVIDNRKREGLSLADYTALGIKHLYSGAGESKGFFLMVEGGKIDWCAHSNDGGGMVYELKDFDDAVKVALDFMKKHPRSTTIVVTADHETGGLHFNGNPRRAVGLLRQKHSYKVMSEKMKKYKKKDFSFAETVALAVNNYKLKDISEAEFERLHDSWEVFTGRKQKSRALPILYASYKPLMFCVQGIFNHRCGLTWTTTGHSAAPVPLMAGGVDAELFSGHYDNTQIALKLKSVIAPGK